MAYPRIPVSFSFIVQKVQVSSKKVIYHYWSVVLNRGEGGRKKRKRTGKELAEAGGSVAEPTVRAAS